ncbi:MAG: hypothetical protein DMF79_07585 [Acidobacteria bacterium]|nr:MAG: hypothetical protein DMF79_07585 [Acidobacteriota bacterium]
MFADFIEHGHFARHIRRVRSLYRERRAALVEALDRELGSMVEMVGDSAGMHLAVTLRKGMADLEVAQHAARLGLWTMPLSSCYLGKPSRQGFVLGYGGTSTAEILPAVQRLRRVVAAVERR